MKERKIKDLRRLEMVWTVPWALYQDDGKWYLNGEHGFTKSSPMGGTMVMAVSRSLFGNFSCEISSGKFPIGSSYGKKKLKTSSIPVKNVVFCIE